MLRHLLFALFALLSPQAGAATDPLKPHDQLVHEVYTFLVSDVGIGGIRTMDGDPQGIPVPPYFYHFAIKHNDGLNSSTSGYPGYASISYPAYTASIGIDAFLAYWMYSGDSQALTRARELADWLLPRRTPATDLYGNWPYSTQTDGVMGGGFDGDAVMSDKPAMFALRCLRLYDITGQASYLTTATEIADTYVATQMGGVAADAGRWPFRVRPSDGLVRQDYTSHLIPAVRLLESMEARNPGQGYGIAAQNAWQWLENNPLNPASPNYMHWEGFYEDTVPAQQVGYLEHYSAESTLLALVERDGPGDLDQAIEILNWSTARYLSPNGVQNGSGVYAPALLEWDLWPNTTYAATAQWAYANLVLHAATVGLPSHDPQWKTRALQALHTITYGQGVQPLPADDRMLTTIRELTQPTFGTDTWYEQNFNTVLYMLACFALAPELAPSNENHMLAQSDGELRAIEYDAASIDGEFAAGGVARFKLAAAPFSVQLGGTWYADPAAETPGWSWDGATQLLELRHAGGAFRILLDGATAVDAPLAGLRLWPPHPNPANPAVTIAFELAHPSLAELDVCDARGRIVRHLRLGAFAAGRHSVTWDGRDDRGHPAASGNYRVRLRTPEAARMQPLVLLK